MNHSIIYSLGNYTIRVMRALGQAYYLLSQSFKDAFIKPYYFDLVIDQIYFIGVKSIPLIMITALSTGMVMALQFGLGLEKFGGKLYIPKIVSLSIIREVGPVFCSLMLAARVGAGMASEIASMVVTQQVDAIRALGTSPIKRIVVPRVLASILVLPILAASGNAIGVLGGLLIGVKELGLDGHFYFEKILSTVTLTDYFTGIGKTVFFALFISLSSCLIGLKVKGGTRGVGAATTQAVVVSSVLILISDFFLTKLFFVLFEA